MKCGNCGQEIMPDAEFCGNCGAKLIREAPVSTMPVVAAHIVQEKRSSGLSVTGMVLGILSLVTAILWFISVPLAIIGLILSCVGMRKGGKGMAITGIITSIVGLCATIMLVALAAFSVNYCHDHKTDKTCSDFDRQTIGVLFRGK